MTEKVFLNEGGVYVTETTIMLKDFAYQVRNISSLRRRRYTGSIYTLLPVILGMVLFALGFPDKNTLILCLSFGAFVSGIILLATTETLYLVTSASEVRAFSTRDRALMDRTVDAILSAMASINR